MPELVLPLPSTMGVKWDVQEANKKLALDAIAVARREKRTRLDLGNMGLRVLDDDIVAAIPKRIRILLLWGNKLEALPPGLSRLKQLRQLTCSMNNLDAIPSVVFTFRHLQELDLSRNAIAAVPRAIARLRHVRTVNLAENQITTVSPAVLRLAKCQGINLSGNRLSVLTRALAQMRSDHAKVHIDDNPLADEAMDPLDVPWSAQSLTRAVSSGTVQGVQGDP